VYVANHTLPVRDMKITKNFVSSKILTPQNFKHKVQPLNNVNSSTLTHTIGIDIIDLK